MDQPVGVRETWQHPPRLHEESAAVTLGRETRHIIEAREQGRPQKRLTQ